jgi:hypothetical protein
MTSSQRSSSAETLMQAAGVRAASEWMISKAVAPAGSMQAPVTPGHRNEVSPAAVSARALVTPGHRSEGVLAAASTHVTSGHRNEGVPVAVSVHPPVRDTGTRACRRLCQCALL